MSHMKNSPFEARMEAYFLEKMTAEERLAFQEELRQDPELRSIFETRVDELADAAIHYMGQMELQQKVAALKKAHPNLAKPRLSFRDWLEILLFRYRRQIGLGLALPIVLFFSLVYLTVPGTGSLVGEYLNKPYEPAVAGSQEAVQLYDAYRHYKSNKPDALAQLNRVCPDFCIATYYRAHLNLREGNYAEAVSDFNQVLAPENWESLAKYAGIQDRCKIEFNLLLARWGMDGDTEATRKGIALLASPQSQCSLSQRNLALALDKKLSSPLRPFRLF